MGGKGATSTIKDRQLQAPKSRERCFCPRNTGSERLRSKSLGRVPKRTPKVAGAKGQVFQKNPR